MSPAPRSHRWILDDDDDDDNDDDNDDNDDDDDDLNDLGRESNKH